MRDTTRFCIILILALSFEAVAGNNNTNNTNDNNEQVIAHLISHAIDIANIAKAKLLDASAVTQSAPTVLNKDLQERKSATNIKEPGDNIEAVASVKRPEETLQAIFNTNLQDEKKAAVTATSKFTASEFLNSFSNKQKETG